MSQRRIRSGVLAGLAVSVRLLTGSPASAASLQKVSDWGATGVPATASMYIYVPDKLATKPPILVLGHYCGGSASAVFGQASGIVKAADQYGFIMVVPQTSNNCWDVGSTKAMTHDGGGDTQAVAEMVKYTLTKYSANADRVYITGDSSGGMLTEGMLAVYPDVFKGGSAFAGVPAGCWGVGDADGQWSSQCAGGQVTHTAQEWGDLVRAMDKGYAGHRPRVQLFHGDADPTINFKNHAEAIKEWTNVLGLSATPTTTTTVTLGSHQAKREQWKNDCGYVVLDAFTSMGGDHGPSDAIFNASFVVPFLGLDKTDATDPEIAQCGASGAGGMGGMGGAMGSGGAVGSAGATGGGTAGTQANGGAGRGNAGGRVGAGGSPGGGGMFASGGSIAGIAGAGGTTGGTDTSTAGMTASGGNTGTGGAGGARSTTAGTGGSAANVGSSGSTAAAGSPATGGVMGRAGSSAGDGGSADSGCGCRLAGPRGQGSVALLLAAALGGLFARRRRHG